MGPTPRIPFEELPEPLQATLAPRVRRLGYLGEFFQVGAHQPEALDHFVGFTESLKRALPDRLVEIVALTVARATANDYERVQHERLALRQGMAEDEVRALSEGRADELELAAGERAALELAHAVVAARGGSCAASYERLEQITGPEVAVGCLMTACRYLAHATMSNTWGIEAPVRSPFAEDATRA